MTLMITCPVCGRRNGYEFRFGGEDKGPRPSDENLSAEAWRDYIHMNANVGGVQKEWWFHRDGCGAWFAISRNTVTNREVPPREEAP